MRFATAHANVIVSMLTLGFVFGMALTLEGIVNIKERCRIESRRNPAVADGLRAFFKSMQQLGNPDLQFVAISGLSAADVVLANVACRLYGVFIIKPSASTVDAWFKISDHATVAGTNPDVAVKLIGTGGGNKSFFLNFGDGLQLGTGATAGSHTANNGNTKSAAADAPTGFGIVGAA
jgi:hypothetical protein